MPAKPKTELVRQLNDAFRKTFTGGQIMLSAGVDALAAPLKAQVVQRTREFADFTEDNDPNGEHDFGNFQIGDQRFFWKIDYYDAAMKYGSPDPSDPAKTTRVLTIMLAAEY